MSVRVRFAPSPTGYLHVGGLRTALYNYLFAKNNNGKFILRIEDTDRSRFVDNATENLIESLQWAGIEFDESPVTGGDFGPYTQSERLPVYQEYIKILLDNGSAYLAFDTPEEIDEMRKKHIDSGAEPKYNRLTMSNQFTLSNEETKNFLNSGKPYVVRLKVPLEDIHFHDIIRGDIMVQGKEIDDQVLIKSDGFPTYHLANVVDDHLMGITHVIRGEEWLPSTPKHILLYKAFGWEIPEFAHLPLLLNKDKSKLSKRQGDVAVEDYRAKGYNRDAFINFIALLGWNPSGDNEIYKIQELIDSFNLEKVNKGGAVFDLVKLDWMNAYYLRNFVPEKEIAKELEGILKNKYFDKIYSIEYLEKIVHLFKERVNFIKEIPEIAEYFFNEPIIFDRDYYQKHWKEITTSLVSELFEKLNLLDNFSHLALHDFVINFIESKGMKLKNIIHALRLMLTGKSSGAGMFETMEILGKDVCLFRIKKFLDDTEIIISNGK